MHRVIGILLSLALPAVQNARESARVAECKNRLRQIGIASHNFHDAHSTFPKGSDYVALLMPYLELQQMHDRIVAYHPAFRHRKQYTSADLEPWRPETFGVAPVFACPSGDVNPAELELSYVRNHGTRMDTLRPDSMSNGTLFMDFTFHKPISFAHVTDGASNTAFWSETLSWQGLNADKEKQARLPGLYWRQIPEKPTSPRELQRLCRLASGRAKSAPDRHTVLDGRPYYQHVTSPNTLPCA